VVAAAAPASSTAAMRFPSAEFVLNDFIDPA
jgi:hypothetical protein